jgi:hypothetical protein
MKIFSDLVFDLLTVAMFMQDDQRIVAGERGGLYIAFGKAEDQAGILASPPTLRGWQASQTLDATPLPPMGWSLHSLM